MDFGANDELDYEEDGLEIESLENNSKAMKCWGNGVNTNRDFPRCDEEDYLEINCSEEDENFFSDERPSKAENCTSSEQSSETLNSKIATEETLEAQKVQKADEESGGAEEQKIYTGKRLCTKTNHSNDFNCNDGIENKKKIKKRKSAQPLPWRAANKKKSMRPLSLNPWPRECYSSEGSGRIKSSGVAPYGHRFLPSHRKCSTTRKLEFSFSTPDAFLQAQVLQQGNCAADKKKFVSSNSPIETINGRNLTQQRFKSLISQSRGPFNADIREFKNDNQTMNLSKKFVCNYKMDCDVSSNTEKLSNAGFTPENAKRDILRQDRGDLIQTCRIGESKGHGLNTFNDLDVRNTPCAPLNKPGWECEGNIDEQRKHSIAVNALKDDEKELVKLKKEARRKRFMQDAITNKKEKESFEPYVATKSCNCVPNDLLKMEEPKLLEEKFQRRENQDCKSDHDFCRLEKTNFKKELLLKKRNPFGGRVEMTKCIAGTKVKEEVFWDKTFECAKSPVLKAAKVEKEPKENYETKVLGGLRSNGPGLFVVKNEMGSQVKFVRTISKSLDELGFGKSKTEVFPERNSDTAFALKPLHFSNENMQEQVTRQLTGRIVKVLNIPPSATTNDILSLCGDIGIVREVKLNFPKENSAVIRFAEPSSAENFFSLYHGQKMNNYFLNVIII